MDLFLAVALTTLSLTATTPSGVELELLIDTTSSLPGTAEDDVWFLDGRPPVPCGAGVLFEAVKTSSAPMGLAYYVDTAGVRVVVDESTVVAGTAIRFEEVGDFRCVEPGRYVFVGGEAPPSTRPASIYEWRVGEQQVRLVQSGGVSIGGHPFGSLTEVGANPLGIGFLGRLEGMFGAEALAAMLFEEEPIFVVDNGDILPGQSVPPTVLTAPQPHGAGLLFRARTFPTTGLYRWSQEEGISVLVDDDTEVPGFPGTFGPVGGFTVLSQGIAFTASFSGGGGIFLLKSDGAIEPLVVPGQMTADGETIFAAGSPDGAGDLFTFLAAISPSGGPIEFVRTPAGEVYRLLPVGGTLQGENIVFVDAGADAQSVAVRVHTLIESGSPLRGAIYRISFPSSVTAIPTLSTAGLVALLTLLLVAAGLLLRRAR